VSSELFTHLISYARVPLALVLIVKFLDINIFIFALALVVIDLFIDFSIYLNSAPVDIPKEYKNFTKNTQNTIVRWLIFISIFWFLGSTICAILEYLGMQQIEYIVEFVNYMLLSVILLHDLHKLKYTRYYRLPVIRIFVDKIYKLFCISDPEKQLMSDQLKGRKV